MQRDVFRCSRTHDQSAAIAAFGTEIDDPICALHNIKIVFDHHERVASVRESAEYAKQSIDISKVQACCRFIKDIQRASIRSACTEFRRKFDALRFTAGKCGGGLTKFEIAESNIHEALQHLGNLRVRIEKRGRVFDCGREEICDALSFELDLQRFACVARAIAHFTRHEHIRKEVHFNFYHSVALTSFATPTLNIK